MGSFGMRGKTFQTLVSAFSSLQLKNLEDLLRGIFVTLYGSIRISSKRST